MRKLLWLVILLGVLLPFLCSATESTYTAVYGYNGQRNLLGVGQ